MANISKYRNIHATTSGVTRCRRSATKPTLFGSAAATSSGFLKSRFHPVYKSATEKRQFRSLQVGQYMTSYRQLCEVYSLTELVLNDFDNGGAITLTYWHALHQLRIKYADIELHIVQSETDNILLSTLLHFPTGYHWYYIPVAPVYRLLQKKATKHIGELLLSVFYYLFNKVKVPYYRQSDSYLYDTYEIVAQWIIEDAGELDEEDYEKYMLQILESEKIGDSILAELRKKMNDKLEKKVQQFLPQSHTDESILFIARRCLYLQQQYPDYNIFQHIPPPTEDEEPDDEPDTLSFYKYISFTADKEGTFNEQIEETLNSEFQEYGNVEEPCIRRYLDGSPLNMKDHLDFEYLFFPMITQLCILLKELP